jgi:hypothetical protein
MLPLQFRVRVSRPRRPQTQMEMARSIGMPCPSTSTPTSTIDVLHARTIRIRSRFLPHSKETRKTSGERMRTLRLHGDLRELGTGGLRVYQHVSSSYSARKASVHRLGQKVCFRRADTCTCTATLQSPSTTTMRVECTLANSRSPPLDVRLRMHPQKYIYIRRARASVSA